MKQLGGGLGMEEFEKTAFRSNFEMLEKVMLWKRFIDDVLMLFKGNKEDCELFVQWLNSLQPGVIKFKYEFSTKWLNFWTFKSW